MANASHIALPAACATTPRIEKIPAPTIPPIPIETAATRPICPDPSPAADEMLEDLAGGMGQLMARFRVSIADNVDEVRHNHRARCGHNDVAKRGDIEIALRRLAPRIPSHEFEAVVDHAVDSPGLNVAFRKQQRGCRWSHMC